MELASDPHELLPAARRIKKCIDCARGATVGHHSPKIWLLPNPSHSDLEAGFGPHLIGRRQAAAVDSASEIMFWCHTNVIYNNINTLAASPTTGEAAEVPT